MLLQCPQETRAPAGWGSGLAGPGWTGPRFIILLLEGDRQTHNVSIRTRSDSRYYSVQVLANNASWCWEQSSRGLTAASWNSSAFTPLITTHTAFLQSAFSHGYSSSESLIRPRGWDVSGLVSMSGLNANSNTGGKLLKVIYCRKSGQRGMCIHNIFYYYLRLMDVFC